MNRQRGLTYVLLIVLLLSGCAVESTETLPDGKSAPAKITLTPADPFEGEAAKLKPFLGNMTGAFTLRYEGKKPHANLDIEIWKHGKKVETVGGVGDLFLTPNQEEHKEIELIISIDTPDSINEQGNMKQIKVAVAHESGTNLYTVFTNPSKKKEVGSTLMSYSNPESFLAKDSIPVWGMQMTSSHKIITSVLSPESLSNIEEAILFTLRFED
ncbi:hypothetical protein [Paenibacillus alvei]|uniref:hypothetical protein n=1 Tax=Paenibacillus alvei TaxID=44250 RepID=UPI0013DACC12|nr:hypothetical protein [Paenibacillus alvei]NEZ41256.1 hypothetical protein [Paenibacillus alvei]